MNYTSADLRQFITNLYGDEDLTILCADYFRDVYDTFAAGMTKPGKIQLLLDHCQRRELMPNLHAALERDRPDQYRKRFGPAAASPGSTAAPPGRDPQQVFISHAHQDTEFAHRLATDLRTRGRRVWIAPDSIWPGEKWAEAIDRGLDECGVFVLVLTPSAVSSGWVKAETYAAIELTQTGEVQFLPVEVASCKPPPMWRTFQRIQFAGRYEIGLKELLDAMGGAGILPISAAHVQRPPEPLANIQIKEVPLERHEATVTSEITAPRLTMLETAVRPFAQAVLLPDPLIIETPIRMELVCVTAGEFLMGSDPKVDRQACDDELPQSRLALPEFYIGKYPVTNVQYAAFVKAMIRQASPQHWENGQIPAGKKDHPVVNVAWRDAVAFCRWLSQASGRSLRLPTEAEWERAARGADGRTYPWGYELPMKELCNFGANVGDTTPVGQYPAGASPCCALDMPGNVWEWTSSLYRPYPYQPEDSCNSPDAEGARVLRGGTFIDDARLVRCAVRYAVDSYYRDGNLGFRVVATPRTS
jgi:formylglycine-generating enzyme required for sulfatase activity